MMDTFLDYTLITLDVLWRALLFIIRVIFFLTLGYVIGSVLD